MNGYSCHQFTHLSWEFEVPEDGVAEIQTNIKTISHVLNEQGTGYKYLKSIEFRNEARHLKKHPKISKFTKFESYWFKRKGMVHFQKSLK